MDVWQIDKLSIFVVSVLPGFVSLVVFESLIPSAKRDFSKSLIEIICFSTINFIALSPFIFIIFKCELYKNFTLGLYIILLLIFIIAPALWPFLYIKFSKTYFFKKYFINPIAKPWDYFFNKKEAAWIIVHLKNGNKIGGKYSQESFASSYPEKEQIFIEEVWRVNSNGVFISKVERTKGIIVIGDDISSIELFN